MLAFGVAAGVSLGACAVSTLLALAKMQDDWGEANPQATYYSQREHKSPEAVGSLTAFLRWFSAPVACVAGAWALAFRAEVVYHWVPALFSTYAASLHKVLPLHPKNVKEAFDLGVVHELLRSGKLSEALQAAAKIAGRNVTQREIEDLPRLIDEMVREKDIVSRVLAVFSLVNIVWFVAIVGLTATAGPFLYTVLRPLREILYEFATALATRIIAGLKRASPLYEVIGYVVAWYLLVESTRYGRDAYSMAGVMTATSSIAVFILSWAHTTAKNRSNSGDLELFMTITWTLGMLYAVPAAVVHQSSFLGYLAMVSAVSAMKFSAYSSGLCTVLGFDNKHDLVRAAFGCGTLTLINLAVKAMGVDSEWTAPFESAVGVLGTSVYLLALDIYAFSTRTWSSHVFFATNLVAYMAVGTLTGQHGTANVAKTFAGLFAFTFYCERVPREKEAFIVWLFALFAGLYGGSLYLNRHPELIASVMSGGHA